MSTTPPTPDISALPTADDMNNGNGQSQSQSRRSTHDSLDAVVDDPSSSSTATTPGTSSAAMYSLTDPNVLGVSTSALVSGATNDNDDEDRTSNVDATETELDHDLDNDGDNEREALDHDTPLEGGLLAAIARGLRTVVHRARTVTLPLYTYPPVYTPPTAISAAPTLYVYQARWPRQRTVAQVSADPESLAWQTLLQFSGLKYDLIFTAQASMSPTATLPFLMTERGRPIASRDRLVHYLHARTTAADAPLALAAKEAARGLRPEARLLLPSDLPPPALALQTTYLALIEAAVLPALAHWWWVEPRNAEKVRAMYTRGSFPPPLESLMFAALSGSVADHLAATAPVGGLVAGAAAGAIPAAPRSAAAVATGAAASATDAIYSAADDAFEALAARLGDGPYFFGDQPSVVDAVLFAALHSFLSADFPADRMRGIVLRHDALYAYARNIWNLWFKRFEMHVSHVRRCGIEVVGYQGPLSVDAAAAADGTAAAESN
ncbi:hypothetical protein BC828DRAFT_378843 [Blastocladiella britannica]|nr:hypothetical protein BC828DRAFT_378843 [Blastocladiella britannica]